MSALLDTIELLTVPASAQLWLYAAVLARLSAVALFMPGLGERVVPVRAKAAVVLTLTMLIAPLAAPAAAPGNAPDYAVTIGAEFVSGSILGLALRAAIFALQTAGAMIAQHLSLSQLFGPGAGYEGESAFATILVMGALAAAAGAGLHFHVAAAIASSYDALPMGAFAPAADVATFAAESGARVMSLAFALALPFVTLGFIYSLALAAASRAMPQLMAAFIGAPTITLAGLALFAATASVILGRWLTIYEEAVGALPADVS